MVVLPVVALLGLAGCALPGMPPVNLWLEVPSEVRAGETVPLKLRVKNISDRPLELEFSPYPKFVVTTLLGRKVWRSDHNAITLPLLGVQTLDPGEELSAYQPLEGKWKQVDNKGRPVRPGVYFVRAVFTTLKGYQDPGHSELRQRNLKTGRKRLVISR